ncbi:poly-beta-1,6 N-acetyl-D-glucosamine export porin PgaA [Microbulbifer sp. HZ11]|uniref:poly-beta-1,6 N-acetyl-D-glucosamine export porin PgaA n=1 Tax=Microbulbifer sp. HZ11 TaxID=1453501 RepID=UPI0005BA83BB|nr:poly-beta-1,6 N-acetyl-D-glucosamine export porin PgaA [Microbulbifer sp. HZ11]
MRAFLGALYLAAMAPLSAFANNEAPLPAEAAVLLEEGRAAFREGDRYTALRLIGEARLIAPDNPHIRRAQADIVMELNAPFAAERARGSSDPGIDARQAALLVRWGEQVNTGGPAHQYDGTDRAILALRSQLQRAENSQPVDEGLVTRLRRDLVIALRDRGFWQQALDEIARLEQHGNALPLYVLQAKADALLAVRLPLRAIPLYQKVIAEGDYNRDARIGLFYAQLEAEQLDAALVTADALAAEGSAWRRIGIDGRPAPNEEWLSNQTLAAQARRLVAMPKAGWQRLQPLVKAAPANAWLRAERGETAAAREWPRRAHQELLIARSLSPDALAIRISTAESLLRRRHWHIAEQEIDALAEVAPGNGQVRRLQRDLAIHQEAELQLELRPSKTRGGGPDAEGGGLDGTLKVFTPPLQERYRLFAADIRTSSTPEGRSLQHNAIGAGIEGRWPDLTLTLAGWNHRGELDGGGASLLAEWQPSDHWGFSADLQRFSEMTPLRALEAGIRADSASVSASYTFSDAGSVSVNTAVADFTDGNHRTQWIISGMSKVLDGHSVDVYMRPTLYTSNNSLRGAPYFNPEEDYSATLSAAVQHRLWRWYDADLVQQFFIELGNYWQQNYPSGPIGSLRYSQYWQPSPRTWLHYGIERSMRRYDGENEYSWGLFLDYSQRF